MFESLARSGQKNIAQGLPWVNPHTGISPEGAARYCENRLRTLHRIAACPSPFRAKRSFYTNPG
jgi:hypothetical protein